MTPTRRGTTPEGAAAIGTGQAQCRTFVRHPLHRRANQQGMKLVTTQRAHERASATDALGSHRKLSSATPGEPRPPQARQKPRHGRTGREAGRTASCEEQRRPKPPRKPADRADAQGHRHEERSEMRRGMDDGEPHQG